MRSGAEFIGKPVIGITDGRKIGSVKDLYLDESLKKVACIHLGQVGLMRKTQLVRREDVMVFGIDAILAKDSNVIIESGKSMDLSNLIKRSSLRGRDVLTGGGTRVGKIQDVVLDEELHVIGFELGRIYIEGPIAERGSIARVSLIEKQSSGEKIVIDFSIAEEQDLGLANYT